LPLRFVGCGSPLPGHDVRIVDAGGKPVEERRQGTIEFVGPSATSGYLHNPQATRHLFRDGWVQTGDLGYLADGELFVTGREKDLVIRAGRNLHPQELEEAVGGVEGVRRGRTAVFGAPDPQSGTERLVVMAETRETGEARERVRAAVVGVCADVLGTPPDDVVLAPPGTILKTSSGKVRRAACRELYELGKVDAGRSAVWRQLVRLVGSSALVRIRRAPRAVAATLYPGWAWLLALGVGVPGWVLVAVIPDPRHRWAVVRGAGRLLLFLSGAGPSVEARHGLPEGPYVVVANHSSPLDGLALAAAIPGPLVFVAAGEFAPRLVSGVFLRRIGAVFVEREDRAKAAEASERLTEAARRGCILVFFPEGRMSRAPGMQPFRMGAFTVAAEAGVPVVPVAIAGTRRMLAADSWRPRPARIRVVTGRPLTASDPGWRAAVDLRNRARAALVSSLEAVERAP
jgi:1-acyl-sn-glycerol-3-phosphate acyltransferase